MQSIFMCSGRERVKVLTTITVGDNFDVQCSGLRFCNQPKTRWVCTVLASWLSCRSLEMLSFPACGWPSTHPRIHYSGEFRVLLYIFSSEQVDGELRATVEIG